MANALRLVSIHRGYDPRDFVLVAFGGAGPVHANRIAAELEVPTLLVPNSPGIFSATGLLVTDLKHDFSVTMIQRAEDLDTDAVERAFAQMLEKGHIVLARESTPAERMSFQRAADMRYQGQSFELTIPLPDQPLANDALSGVLEAFHRGHEQAYGFAAPEEPVEFVNLRVTAVGGIVKPALRRLDRSDGNAGEALTGRRDVYFEETDGRTDCPIYDRTRSGDHRGAGLHGGGAPGLRGPG